MVSQNAIHFARIGEKVPETDHSLKFLGLFEFTPTAPPAAPETASRRSFFMPIKLPVTAAPHTAIEAYIISPQRAPSAIPLRRLYFPQKNEPVYPPVIRADKEKYRENFMSPRKKYIISADKTKNSSMIISPNADESSKLRQLFVQMLRR